MQMWRMSWLALLFAQPCPVTKPSTDPHTRRAPAAAPPARHTTTRACDTRTSLRSVSAGSMASSQGLTLVPVEA